MTAVTIRGTFKKDSRPSNGLETIADGLVKDTTKLYYVVGVVKWAGGNVGEDGDLTPAVKFLAIEPLTGQQAGDAAGILDVARKARQLGRFEDEHPIQPSLFEYNADDDKPTQVGEVRLTDQGPREVPEPSGEEVVAELDERRAAKAKPATDPFTPGGAE